LLAVVYLIAGTVAGLAVVQRLMPGAPPMVKIPGGLLLGIIGAGWITYIVAFAFSYATDNSLTIGIIAAILVEVGVIGLWGRNLRIDQFRLSWFEILFIGASLAFSFWLMDNRLFVDHDQPGNPLLVSSETWGDTALHVALSRSFSVGANYPTEYPFFANEPIRYHFGYDFFAGALQKGGLSVLLSFNLPGALGFTSMMMLMFSLGRMLFGVVESGAGRWWRDRGIWVGLMAVALLMTNQSLEWWRYFNSQKDGNGSVWTAIKPATWWHHERYLTIGPYTQEKIAIFNTLNVYLTQTHLIVAMAFVFFVAYGLLQPLRRNQELSRNRMLLLGVAFGLSFWLNGVLWIAAGVFFGSALVIFGAFSAWRHSNEAPVEERLSAFGHEALRWAKMCGWFIVPALAIGIPQSIWLNGGLHNDRSIQTHIGYLVCSSPESKCYANGQMDIFNLSHWGAFFDYWWLNEGLVIPLLVVAFLLGNRSDKKLIAAVSAIFIWGSIFQLSRDLGGHNHKVFNLWENFAGLWVAFALVEVWNVGSRRIRGSNFRMPAITPFAWGTVAILFFFLVASGLVDFMTIKNDFEVSVFGDQGQPEAEEWIVHNTPKDSVFLTTWGELYTVPTLSGRGVYLGYDPWASSAGYDVVPREQRITQIYSAQSKDAACALLTTSDIDYVFIGPQERSGQRFQLNEALFKDQFTLVKDITSGNASYDVYSVEQSCGVGAG
jgi:hypothetical protein